jgi:hypothetical protein
MAIASVSMARAPPSSAPDFTAKIFTVPPFVFRLATRRNPSPVTSCLAMRLPFDGVLAFRGGMPTRCRFGIVRGRRLLPSHNTEYTRQILPVAIVGRGRVEPKKGEEECVLILNA